MRSLMWRCFDAARVVRVTDRLCVALLVPLLGLTTGCSRATPEPGPVLATGEVARAQLEATERAFAKSMADRDFAAFPQFISEEIVLFSGTEPVRGAAAVTEHWRPSYEGAQAPFSWQPDQFEVLPSGTLALSTGTILDPQGTPIARFNSIWRQEAPGVWRIVFDRDEPLPAAPAAP